MTDWLIEREETEIYNRQASRKFFETSDINLLKKHTSTSEKIDLSLYHTGKWWNLHQGVKDWSHLAYLYNTQAEQV